MTAEAIAAVIADLKHGRTSLTIDGNLANVARDQLKLAAQGGLVNPLNTMIDTVSPITWVPTVNCNDVYRQLLGGGTKEFDNYKDFVLAPPWPAACYCYANDHGNVVVMMAVTAERDSATAGDFVTMKSQLQDERRTEDSLARTLAHQGWYPEHAVEWDRVRWITNTFVWVGGRSSRLGPMPTHGPLIMWRWALYDDGMPADLHWVQLHKKLPIDEWDMASAVMMSAINLLNCTNVDVVDYEPTTRPERRRLERSGVRLSTIHVFPAGKRRPGDRGEPVGVAHHGVRGHYAKYGPKYGRKLLFGKYEGRFYIPRHVRGTKEQGEVTADYELHAEG